MTTIYIVIAAAAAAALVYTIAAGVSPERKDVLENLARTRYRQPADDHTPNIADSDSLVTELVRRFTPKGMKNRLESMYNRAGQPPMWKLEKAMLVKIGSIPLMLGLGSVLKPMLPEPWGLVVMIALPVLGFFLPELLLYSESSKRKEQVQLELPELLDQMSIAVQAGLGFDAAMQYAAENNTGPLSEEMGRTVRDMHVGMARRDAFLAMSERCGVDDVRTFVKAIVRASEHGMSITDVLKAQADDMRIARRMRAEEKAAQIPTKVTIPLMLFIMPVLFIVVIGPAVINILETLL